MNENVAVTSLTLRYFAVPAEKLDDVWLDQPLLYTIDALVCWYSAPLKLAAVIVDETLPSRSTARRRKRYVDPFATSTSSARAVRLELTTEYEPPLMLRSRM